MSKIINKLNDVYKPYAAIIAYKAKDSSSDTTYYVEHRAIKNGKMGVGYPLTENKLASLIKDIKTTSKQLDNSLHGVMPQNVLFCDTRIEQERLIWWRSPEQRHMYFSDRLEIPDGMMWVPGLIYEAKANGLMIYAFKGRKPTDKLFHAPFMNVSDYVCLGNAKVERPKVRTFANVIAYWEKMFWLSEFSHILGGNPIEGNIATLSKQLIATGEHFPLDVLKPIQSKKLKDLLK